MVNLIKKPTQNKKIVNYISSLEWSHVLVVEGKQIKFKIDTRSQVNILSKKYYNLLKPKPRLSTTAVILSAYNNTDVPVHGKCVCLVEHKEIKLPILFIVTDDFSPILGLNTRKTYL